MADATEAGRAEGRSVNRVDDVTGAALRREGHKISDLNPEQRERAGNAGDEKPGLRGKALVAWIIDGEDLPLQQKKAEQGREVRQAAATEKRRSDGAKKAGTGGSRPKYPEDVREAVKIVHKLKGTSNGSPGPKQHVHVRNVVAKSLGAEGPDEIVKAAVVEASGAKSVAALKRLATGEADRSELKVLHPLAAKMGDDAFCKGRNLAAILTAWTEQL